MESTSAPSTPDEIPVQVTIQELYDAVHKDLPAEEPIAEQLDTVNGAIEFEKLKPPRMDVIRGWVVACHGPKCGIIAIRKTKPAADLIIKEHRELHIAQNRRVESLLTQFRDTRDTIVTEAIEAATAPPEEPEPEYIPDGGYLDWQFGSATSGRDPEKMWHRVCGGEVVFIMRTRVCTTCGKADTASGGLE